MTRQTSSVPMETTGAGASGGAPGRCGVKRRTSSLPPGQGRAEEAHANGNPVHARHLSPTEGGGVIEGAELISVCWPFEPVQGVRW